MWTYTYLSKLNNTYVRPISENFYYCYTEFKVLITICTLRYLLVILSKQNLYVFNYQLIKMRVPRDFPHHRPPNHTWRTRSAVDSRNPLLPFPYHWGHSLIWCLHNNYYHLKALRMRFTSQGVKQECKYRQNIRRGVGARAAHNYTCIDGNLRVQCAVLATMHPFVNNSYSYTGLYRFNI